MNRDSSHLIWLFCALHCVPNREAGRINSPARLLWLCTLFIPPILRDSTMQVTAVWVVAAVALATHAPRADADSLPLVLMDATIVDPPVGSIIGGGLVELAVLPSSPAAVTTRWTLCAQASDLANTSCITCEAFTSGSVAERPACKIEVTTGEVGVIEPRVWATGTADAPFDKLRTLVMGPSSAKTRLGVLVSTPIEVFRLGVSELWQRPFETSKSWWGRSTAPALSNARTAAQEAELLDEPAVALPMSAPPAPPLSLRRHSTFLGPTLPSPIAASQQPRVGGSKRVLVAVVAGARGANVVDASLSSLQASLGATRGLDILLMTYDGTDWEQVASEGAAARRAGDASAPLQTWASEATVVRRRGHMKWWFIKRFVSPALAASGEYGWVLVLDEDALLAASFDGDGFFATLEQHKAVMGQPMHADASETSFGFLQEAGALRMARTEGKGWDGGNTLDGLPVPPAVAEDDVQPGAPDGWGNPQAGEAEVLWTTMVECGPVSAFRADAWPCVWELLQADLTSGFGYDLVWASRCARDEEGIASKAGPGLRAAVTLHHRLEHADLGTASSLHAGFFRRAVGEGLVLFERLRAAAAHAAELAEAQERVVMADPRGMQSDEPADASELIRKALRVDQAQGVMPMEPRVIGVGRRSSV